MTTYTETTWVNGSTKLSAANMNNIEDGITAVTNEVIAIEASANYAGGLIYAYKNIGGAL